jgi:hypothetical protein
MTEDGAPFDTKEAECVESALERRFIEEYLESKGYQRSDLGQLPEHEARTLMIEACKYATLKLAEIEARSKFRKNIQLPH